MALFNRAIQPAPPDYVTMHSVATPDYEVILDAANYEIGGGGRAPMTPSSPGWPAVATALQPKHGR